MTTAILDVLCNGKQYLFKVHVMFHAQTVYVEMLRRDTKTYWKILSSLAAGSVNPKYNMYTL